jgi:hypothetical protein
MRTNRDVEKLQEFLKEKKKEVELKRAATDKLLEEMGKQRSEVLYYYFNKIKNRSHYLYYRRKLNKLWQILKSARLMMLLEKQENWKSRLPEILQLPDLHWMLQMMLLIVWIKIV